jgi:hypothetical protein
MIHTIRGCIIVHREVLVLVLAHSYEQKSTKRMSVQTSSLNLVQKVYVPVLNAVCLLEAASGALVWYVQYHIISEYASTGNMESTITFKQAMGTFLYLSLAPNSHEFVLNRNAVC